MRKIGRLACASLCFTILSFIIFIHPPSPAAALGDVMVDLSFAPSAVEAGTGTYPIGYVRLVSNSTGEPVLSPSNLEVQLLSDDASIAFVPSRVTIPAGSDYARFDVEVSDLTGETEISAIYGDRTAAETFRVVDALNPIEDVNLVINLASDKMQIDSEMPFSVYLQDNGNVMQAPKDITIHFDYESSLVGLNSDSVVIEKGSYYATGSIMTFQKSGNAFIKATSEDGADGELLTTVTNVEISQTQPVSLTVHVFPDKVGLNENNIDIFVGLVDAEGNPTVAAADVTLELFSSAYELATIDDLPAVIKKGEFGFYARQYMNFYTNQTVTIGASTPGLGAGTASFEVLKDSLLVSDPKAVSKTVKVFTVGTVPSEEDAIAVYQLNAIEDDFDDIDCNQDGVIEAEDIENTDCDEDGLFDVHRDYDKDGVLEFGDWHPIDDLDGGDLYPIESASIYSQSQGNLNVVSGDNLSVRITDPGYIASGSSYGTAKVTSGRQTEGVDISASIANIAVGENTMAVVGGLNPTQTKIFSPGGTAEDGSYRVLFDSNGLTDLFFVALDSAGRPSNSDQGVKYLVKPVNELTEIKPGSSFSSMHIGEDYFKAGDVVVENKDEEITAIPVGVNSDSNLETTSSMHLLFHTGTASQVMLPFNSTVAFSRAHQIGVVQLRDDSGNPVLAPENTTVTLSSSSISDVLPASSLTIPAGKSFASFGVATFGRADNFTIYATADGLQASSAAFAPVVAELPASFIGPDAFDTSVKTAITVSTPIQGASITWGASSGLQLLGNATGFAPSSDSYAATRQVMADKPGTFTVDATLLKDGFKPTRISKELAIGQYQKQMNAVLIDDGDKMLAYGQAVQMRVSVKDATGLPVVGATVQVEDSGSQGLMLVTSTTTDATGTASFVYAPTNTDQSSNTLTLMVTAYKDGYQPSRDSKIFEIDGSSKILPPIPVIGTALGGLPSWASYAILGGVAAVGGGFYMLRKPKVPENEESLVEEPTPAEQAQEETTEQAVEESGEDEEDEEEI